MNIHEIEVSGTRYRGPQINPSVNFPYKITVYRQSGKMSTSGSGLPVGFSWQTWKRFRSLSACEVAMDELGAEATRGSP